MEIVALRELRWGLVGWEQDNVSKVGEDVGDDMTAGIWSGTEVPSLKTRPFRNSLICWTIKSIATEIK